MWRRWIGALSYVACFAPAALAYAEELPWQAPPPCPSRAQLEDTLAQRPAAAQALARKAARVRIGAEASGGLRAEIHLRSQDGEETRVLRDADCEALSEAVLLVIELAADGLQSPPEPATVAPSQPTPPAAPPPEPAPPARPKESSAAMREPAGAARHVPTTGGLAFASGVDVGSLPSATLSVTAGGVLLRGPWWLQLSGDVYLPRSARLANDDGVGGDFGLFGASMHTCVLPWEATVRRARPRWGPCVALELGAATGRGVGLDGKRRAHGLFVIGSFGAMVGIELAHPIQPFLQLEAGRTFKAPIFETPGLELHRANRWVGRGTVGAAWLWQ